MAIFAASGRSFIAIWDESSISGLDYWVHICTSPELLIFVLFMMSDPGTAPKLPTGRMIYGAATAVIAAGLIFFQPTECGIKVAILASLTITCAVVPFIEALARRLRRDAAAPAPAAEPRPPRARPFAPVLRPATLAVVLIVTTAFVGTAALTDNDDLVLIERGLTGPRNAQ